MRCLYCSSYYQDEKDLREHHENQHQVDKNNFFYKALFAEEKKKFYF